MNTIETTRPTASRTRQGGRDSGADQLPAPIRNRLAQQGLVAPSSAKPAPAGKPNGR